MAKPAPAKSLAAPAPQALRDFAAAVAAKTGQLVAGAPEEQLRAPFENLMSAAASAWGWRVVCTGEAPLPDRLGRPDFAVHRNGLLAGYVELKAPGTGADAGRFKGRNRAQFKRFAAVPNLLYSDGNEWALHRSGKRIGPLVRLSGNIAEDGAKAAAGAPPPWTAFARNAGRRISPPSCSNCFGSWRRPWRFTPSRRNCSKPQHPGSACKPAT